MFQLPDSKQTLMQQARRRTRWLVLTLVAALVWGCSPDEEAPQPQPALPLDLKAVVPVRSAPGARITLKGVRFSSDKAASKVYLRLQGAPTAVEVPADSLISATDTTLALNLPRTLALGHYSIRLTQGSQADSLTNALELLNRPVVNSTNVQRVVPGQAFHISGANFANTPANNLVTLGSTALTVTAATDTSLDVTVPTTMELGTFQVAVTVNSVTSQQNPSVTIVQAPTLTGYSPATGIEGQTLTLAGTGFHAPVVYIGTTRAVVTASTATSISCTVPDGLTDGSTYAVKVVSDRVELTAATAMPYRRLPQLVSTEYTTYVGGQTLLLTARYAVGAAADNVVRVGGLSLPVQTISGTQPKSLSVNLPSPMTPGTYTVRLISDGISSADSLQITVAAPPVITSLSPVTAIQGAEVTLAGSGFASPTVAFGTVDAVVTASSPTSITCVVPAGLTANATYAVKVTSNRAVATASQLFTSLALPAPRVVQTEYYSYIAGEQMNVLVNYASLVAGQNEVKVYNSFGEEYILPVLKVERTGAQYTLSVRLPETISEGGFRVSYSVDGGSSSVGLSFTIDRPLKITKLSSYKGMPGDVIEIEGDRISSATIWFGDVQAAAVYMGTRLHCTIPAGLVEGQSYTVTATLGRYSVAAPQSFTVAQVPQLVRTDRQNCLRGNTFTLEARGVTGGVSENRVFLGTTELTPEAVILGNPSTLTVRIPASHPYGTYQLKLISGGVESGNTLYMNVVPPPAIYLVTPTTGPVGTSVTISGNHFYAPASIRVGTTNISLFALVSNNALSFSIPVGLAPGTYPIIVTSNGVSVTAGQTFTVTAPLK